VRLPPDGGRREGGREGGRQGGREGRMDSLLIRFGRRLDNKNVTNIKARSLQNQEEKRAEGMRRGRRGGRYMQINTKTKFG